MRTLYDIASEMEDDYAAGCILTLAQSSDLFIGLPFMNLPGGAFAYNQEGTLPGVGFLYYNQKPPKGVKILNPGVETLKIVGGDCDVDCAIVRTRGMEMRASQVNMKLKAIGLNLADVLINGNSEGNYKVFDGFRKRIVGDGKLKYNITKSVFWNVQQLIDMVPGCTHLITSKAQRRHITAASRRGEGQISYTIHEQSGVKLCNFVYEDKTERSTQMTVDQIQVTVIDKKPKVREIPILVADYNDAGQRIINDGAIMAVRFGDGYCMGLSCGDPHVRDFGECESAPVYRTRLEWYATLAILHGEGAAILA